MEVEFLINLVRERPPIYDPSDRNHRDRDVIAALWKEVAAAMKSTGKTTVLFTMNYTLGYELYITRSFGVATQELQLGKQSILSRYHELPWLLL